MRIPRSLLLWVLVVIVAACGKADEPSVGGAPTPAVDSLAGTWKLESEKPDVSGSMVFTQDTFSTEFKDGDRTETISGKYSVSGNVLTLTPEMEGGKPSNDKPEVATLSDDKKSFEARGLGKFVKQ